MKRYISMILAVLLMLSCLVVSAPVASAAVKAEEPRAIALVFDNSGSMYTSGNQAWCRATYAMEVFASMLNENDVLQIYPMWPITIDGTEYTTESPFQITGPSQANKIRALYTDDPGGTPIESIDCGAAGLKQLSASKKYLVILTDGSTFSKNGHSLDKKRTVKELDNRVNEYAGADMTVMYLGIGEEAAVPETAESEYFVKNKAEDTADVLSMLTVMCNQIFGRDTLPASRISGNSMEFDISMKKLIVFVQGENIDDLKLGGGFSGKLVESRKVQYAVSGAGDKYKNCVSDTSLQGMMVTYTDCAAGQYSIEHSGSATSVEVYYEPDADLDFVFTDAAGNTVDPNALYEGDYKVSFGMKDARTGQLISSELLGNPRYQGSYYIDGNEVSISHEGFNGSVDIPLKMGEKFTANLTVTYLSGYTISKDSSDFGWPEGGIEVAARPAGDMRLEISGGEDLYSLQDLEEGEPYIAKVFYQGTQLTGSELESVELKWDPDTSNADIQKEFADDHWKLYLRYKDPAAPQDTVCGECTVSIFAYYSAQGSSQAQAQSPLKYNIKDDFSPLQIDAYAQEDYIVIKELEASKPIIVELKLNGAPLSAEDFAAVQLQVDCGGIEHTLTPDAENSAYQIKLLPTEGIAEGDYFINVTAKHTDQIGRESEVDDTVLITLSTVPLWVKWLTAIGLLLLLIILIWLIAHIPALPTKVREEDDSCTMNVGGRDVKEGAELTARRGGKQVEVQAKYFTCDASVSLLNIRPGPRSYISTPNARRSIEVKPENVSVFGDVTRIEIEDAKITVNDGVLQWPQDLESFIVSDGTIVKITGTLQDGVRTKNFIAKIPLIFKK